MTDIASIAKAIHDRQGLPVEWDKESPTVQAIYRSDAIAAVQAMREPSIAMREAAYSQVIGASEAVSIWTAMIDELLKTA